jgi:assimilatory nitrate reductase catalytic subunit
VRLQPLLAHSYASLICRTQAADRLHVWLSAAARPEAATRPEEEARAEIVHWYRLPVAGGYRYELALGKSIDWRALGERLLEIQQADLHGQRLQLFQAERWLAYSTQAEWIVFASTDWQSLPDRRALEASLVQSLPALPAQLLRDLPASVQMLCTCMQVSRTQIEEAIAAGADSVEILGEQLGCGTNCGSCKPEIAAVLRGLAAGKQELGLEEEVA